MQRITVLLLVAFFSGVLAQEMFAEESAPEKEPVKAMKLGNFSVSLAVKDIKKSKAFYEKLGFKQVGGVLKQNWVILQNETTNVGLFQGMFPKNLMTFNPGWNHKQETPEEFQDVRELQKRIEESGIKLTTKADPDSTGPASFVISDPDGNTILFDQHVPAPGKKK